MGFLELVAAVKFLSSAELAFNLGWVTRSVFLALWAAILFIAALYTLGWVRLAHEDDDRKIGWFRRAAGVATAVAAVWCLAGIQGRSLGLFDSFAPPDPYPGHTAAVAAGQIHWLDSYDEAVAQAKTAGKPIFINFTGVNCSNCRWMERNMLPQPEVKSALDKYVTVELYTDRPMDKDRQALQKKLVGVALNPTYVVATPEGAVIRVHQGLEQDKAKFLEFLESGLSKVASR
jgi:thiol:disulfide interchange protein DsbD